MRLSVNHKDPGYDPARITGAHVMLNGVRIYHCVTADEELGFVDVFVLDARGKFVIGPGGARIERRHGHVWIYSMEDKPIKAGT